MRKLLFLLTAFISYQCGWSQKDQLIKLALSDISNFEVMSFFSQGEKMPKRFYVFDSTTYWPNNRFYMEGLKGNEAKWARDEHHPYNFRYLFKDSLLNTMFPDAEKKALSAKAAAQKQRRIQVRTPIASAIPSYRSIQSGFIVRATDPVYSSDSVYAFLNFSILEKRNKPHEMNHAYHSTVCVIYRKENRQWKKWNLQKRVIL